MPRPKKAVKTPAVVLPYTLEQLKAMVAELEPKSEVIMLRGVPADMTVGMSIDDLPPHVIANKADLPPVDNRSAAFATAAPAKTYLGGDRHLHGILGAFGVQPQAPLAPHINPTTGFPHNQVVAAPRGGIISPPPSRNFKGS